MEGQGLPKVRLLIISKTISGLTAGRQIVRSAYSYVHCLSRHQHPASRAAPVRQTFLGFTNTDADPSTH